jgi:hypothetical protein
VKVIFWIFKKHNKIKALTIIDFHNLSSATGRYLIFLVIFRSTTPPTLFRQATILSRGHIRGRVFIASALFDARWSQLPEKSLTAENVQNPIYGWPCLFIALADGTDQSDWSLAFVANWSALLLN